MTEETLRDVAKIGVSAMVRLEDVERMLGIVADHMVTELMTEDPTSDLGRRAERLALNLRRVQSDCGMAISRMADEIWVQRIRAVEEQHPGVLVEAMAGVPA